MAGPGDGHPPLLDGDVERVVAGLQRQGHALVQPSRFIDAHHDLGGGLAVLGLAVVVLKIALDPTADPVGLIDEGVAVAAGLVGGFELLPAAGGGRHVAQAVVADDHHAVFAVDGGTHLINIVHLVFDHALDSRRDSR